MKYKCFYNDHCLSLSKVDSNKAKEFYNEFINDIKTETLLTLYKIELSLQKNDYNLIKVYITCLIDILLMINENDNINKFKLFFESYIYDKSKQQQHNYNYIYRYCVENDIINTITDSI